MYQIILSIISCRKELRKVITNMFYGYARLCLQYSLCITSVIHIFQSPGVGYISSRRSSVSILINSQPIFLFSSSKGNWTYMIFNVQFTVIFYGIQLLKAQRYTKNYGSADQMMSQLWWRPHLICFSQSNKSCCQSGVSTPLMNDTFQTRPRASNQATRKKNNNLPSLLECQNKFSTCLNLEPLPSFATHICPTHVQ